MSDLRPAKLEFHSYPFRLRGLLVPVLLVLSGCGLSKGQQAIDAYSQACTKGQAMQRSGPLLIAVLATVCLGAEQEPTYKEKTLGDWAAQAKDRDAQVREQAAQALGRMGADAKAATDGAPQRRPARTVSPTPRCSSPSLAAEKLASTACEKALTRIQENFHARTPCP